MISLFLDNNVAKKTGLTKEGEWAVEVMKETISWICFLLNQFLCDGLDQNVIALQPYLKIR